MLFSYLFLLCVGLVNVALGMQSKEGKESLNDMDSAAAAVDGSWHNVYGSHAYESCSQTKDVSQPWYVQEGNV